MIGTTGTRWAFATAWFVLALSTGACNFREAYGKPRRSSADAGAKQGDSNAGPVKPDAGTRNKGRRTAGSSLVGLTRAEVVARKGEPTKKDGNVWLYTYVRWCRDRSTSDVVIFKGNVVVKEETRIEETDKTCTEPDWGDR